MMRDAKRGQEEGLFVSSVEGRELYDTDGLWSFEATD